MTPATSFRVRFALAAILAGLVAAFAASPAGAQHLRGRPMRGGEIYSFSCGNCGADLGTSDSPFGPTGVRICPRCKAHLVGTKDAPSAPKVSDDNRGTMVLGLICAGVLTLGVAALVLLIVLVKLIGKKSTVEGTGRGEPDDRDYDDREERRERRQRERSRRSRRELE